ncbi:MAG TPA: hypothetical protein VIP51_00525 [Eoetvoesiella sp.]
MKQLARKPLLLAFILTFPLWILLGNFIVAASAGLLLAFFIAMCHALYVLQRRNTTGADQPAKRAWFKKRQ